MKKKTMFTLAIIMLVTLAASIPTHACSLNEKFAKEYASTIYGNAYKVKLVKEKNLTNKMLLKRKEKHIVYVSIIKSRSCGNYGITDKGEYIKYNKKVRKGKIKKSFLIYNPESTSFDNIIAVIDNGKVRITGEVS